MARRSDWRRRWASLSALASAALAASSGSGEAAIIYHPTSGFGIPGSLPLPGGQSISVFNPVRTPFHSVQTFNNGHSRGVFGVSASSASLRARGVEFRVAGAGIPMVSGGGPIVAVTKRGRTFNMVGTGITNSAAIVEHRHRYDDVFATARFRSGSGKGVTRPLAGSGVSRFVEHVLSRRYLTTSKGQKVSSIVFSAFQRSTTNLPLSYNNEYALFRFDIGPKTDYGWLELSVNYVGTGGAGGPENYDLYPVVDVLGYAYDTNGKPLPAGAIPEPQRLPLALGALALGAVGVGEWRKKRNATT